MRIDGQDIRWQYEQPNTLYFGKPGGVRPAGRYQYRVLYEIPKAVRSSWGKDYFVWHLRQSTKAAKFSGQTVKISFPVQVDKSMLSLTGPGNDTLGYSTERNGSIVWQSPSPFIGHLKLNWPAGQIRHNLHTHKFFKPDSYPLFFSFLGLVLLAVYSVWVQRPARQDSGDGRLKQWITRLRQAKPATATSPGIAVCVGCFCIAGYGTADNSALITVLIFCAYSLFILGLLIKPWRMRNRLDWLGLVVGLATSVATAFMLANQVDAWFTLLFMLQLPMFLWSYRLISR